MSNLSSFCTNEMIPKTFHRFLIDLRSHPFKKKKKKEKKREYDILSMS